MHNTTRGLTLIGLALLLANCVTKGPGDSSSSTSKTDGSKETDPAAVKADNGASNGGGTLGSSATWSDGVKRNDTRGALSAVTSGGDRMTRSGGDLAADARVYAAQIATRSGVRNPDFSDFRTSTGTDGLEHVRLNQMHQGLKVWGADVVVHATSAELIGLAGSISANDLDALDVNDVTLDNAATLALAKADRYGSRLSTITTSRESVEKIIFIDNDSVPHVAMHATFFNEFQNGFFPGLWNYIYDAKTGDLLARFNGIDTVVSQASGPGGNVKVPHTWTNELDVESSGASSGYVMNTATQETTNMNHSQSGNGTDFTSTSLTFSDAAANDAHGYGEVTLQMLSQWMGHNSIDDQGFKLLSRVHYGNNYENAFWDGQEMSYGDGGQDFYEMSGALDVVGHEIDHGYTERHSGLGYSSDAGGLNEGFSDIAGKTAQWFYYGTATWDLGADIFKQAGALRYMCDPTQDGASIDNASNMNASIDPHYSSGIPNKAFCVMSKRLSNAGDVTKDATQPGVRRAATAFYLANAQYWTSSTTFTQACQGTVDAARALSYTADEVTSIKASWADVGVFCDGAATPPPPCDETLTDASGTVTSPNYPSPYGNNYAHTWCIDAPTGEQVTLTFTDFATESGYDFVSVGDSTGAVKSKTSGTTKPADITSSRVYLTFTSDEGVTKNGWKATWTSN